MTSPSPPEPSTTSTVLNSPLPPGPTVSTVLTSPLPPGTSTTSAVLTSSLPPGPSTASAVLTSLLPPGPSTASTVLTSSLPPGPSTASTVLTSSLPPRPSTASAVLTSPLGPGLSTTPVALISPLPPGSSTTSTVLTSSLPPGPSAASAVSTTSLPPGPSTASTVLTSPLGPGSTTSTVLTSCLPPGPSTASAVLTSPLGPGSSTTSKVLTSCLPPGPSTTSTVLTSCLPPGPSTASAVLTSPLGPGTFTASAALTSLLPPGPSTTSSVLTGPSPSVHVGSRSSLQLSDNQKRWAVVGIGMHLVLLPALLNVVKQEISRLYSSLKSSRNIDTQVSGSYMKTDGSFRLNYDSINNNKKGKPYDYRVSSSEDLGKLYLQPHMAKFTGFDNTCDLSAVLGILANASVFHPSLQDNAKKVRSQVRNEWGHCNFEHWDELEFTNCFKLMKTLVTSLKLPAGDEKKICTGLLEWEINGLQLCIDSLLNKDLVKLVSDQVANLEYGVNLLRKSSADETKKISYALQNVRCEFDKHLGDLLEKVEKVEERVEKGEKRVEKVEGQVEKGEERVEKIEERVEKGEERVEKVEERVEKGKEKVERVEERLEKGEKRVEKVQQRVEKGEERVEKVEERVEKGKERVEKVEEQMSDMKFRQEELEAAMSSMKDSHNIYNVTNSAKVVPLQVPSRNPYFCGRDNELGAITAVLKGAERGCAQLAICGLGGVGKTSLTVEFLWRCKEEYQGGIFWISGESNTLFQSSFCELAHQIGTFIQNDFPSTLSKTLDWLQRQHHLWCLVVDNLDEADLSEELRKLLRGKWKQRAHGNIIITTRRETRQVAEVLGIEERCCVDLYCLTEEDSIQFLRKRTERAKGEDSEIRELIGLLGALPLALDQAAAYIRCVRCSLKDYVEQYKKQKLLLLKKKEARDVEETTSRQRLAVHTTWLMNFEHIKNNQSYEQSVREATNLVMEVSAFLCPDEIPFEMINEGLPPIDDESGITDVLREPLGRDEILSLLTEFSLFQRCGTNSFRVHRLVQEVIRGRLDRVREKFVFSCAKSFLMKAEQCTPLSEKAHLALSKNKFYIDRKEFTDKLDETSDQFAMLDEKKQESENACPSGKKGEKKREGMLPWFFKKDGKRKAKARLEIHYLDDEVKPGFVSSVASPAVQPQREVRITDVPYPVVLRMCMLLDVESFLGNDYRMLAALLGLDNRTIGHLKMTISPSEVILTRIFPTMFNPGTLDCLIAILTKMERYDVIHVIDEWVDSQTCTQGAQDN